MSKAHAKGGNGEGRKEVYQWMADFLDEKWGRGGSVRHG